MKDLINCLIILAFSACGITAPATKISSVENPVLKDTTKIISAPDQNLTEIKSSDKKLLKVAVMLPFYTNELEYDSLGIDIISVSQKSNLALQYYRGIEIALDSLDKAGIKTEVSVSDTKKDTFIVKNLMTTSAIKNADVLIGPVSNSSLPIASELMDQKKQVLFSPLSSSYNISENNPHFFFANAGLKTHCEKISNYIEAKYPNKKIIFLYRRNENETEYVNWIKSKLKTTSIELTEKQDSCYNKVEDFLSVLNTNIIIIPSFDEEFVNLITKHLFELTENYRIEVFGMPTWDDMESLRIDYLQKLNTHITGSFYVDDSLRTVQAFRNSFRQKFNARPDEYSYKGYSLMMMIGTLWKQYGDKWIEHLNNPIPELGVEFSFEEVDANNDLKTDFVENKFVYLLKYQNYRLIKLK